MQTVTRDVLLGISPITMNKEEESPNKQKLRLHEVKAIFIYTKDW